MNRAMQEGGQEKSDRSVKGRGGERLVSWKMYDKKRIPTLTLHDHGISYVFKFYICLRI